MSELLEELAIALGVQVRRQGSLRLIRFQDCAAIVGACTSAGLLIVGIEAFEFADGKIVPDTDLIADFSELVSKPWKLACEEAVQSAEIYFGSARGRSDLWFEFSLLRLQ